MGKIRKVVITGGGTAGWVAAAALSHQFRDLLDIVLVESEQIGTVGVGESTIPPLRTFHRLLQIDEREFMRAVAATFKLSISYENWLRPGDHYFHPFGHTGLGTWACDFHHFWLDGLRRGMRSELGDFCRNPGLALRADSLCRTGRKAAITSGPRHASVHSTGSSRGQLCLPARRGSVRALPAPLRRAPRPQAHRGQDP